MSLSAAAANAAQAFRRFFAELRETYLEREALFTQVELALLCREHVLIVGPPGTAKSSIASAVLSRISDEKTGRPSLFAKQLSESTVQTDLIGPVDFKVLTETGRTEYLTDDGMLGATYAFLDEVFDGRDMLLRSILNVLHERELKHGRKVTAGKLETAILTSNRYLSEVLARSPELLLAFADRLSFVCFVPKSFAHPSSRAAMLQRFSSDQRPDLRAALSVQQLDVLQELVDGVKVTSEALEGLELLTDELERRLQAQVAKLPDYVPTKYFSQRSVVKAMWALKAAVVRDAILRGADRKLEASPKDLDALRHFFLLGGPPPEEAEAMLKVAADPRERAQLEILRLEHRAFDEVVQKIRGELSAGLEREAAALKPSEDLANAEGLARSYTAAAAAAAAKALRAKLVPGPRHPRNREAVLQAARATAAAAEQRIARGSSAQGEWRGGGAALQSFAEVLELCRLVPELHPDGERLSQALLAYASQALEMVRLAAFGTEFEEAVRLEALATLAQNVEEELSLMRGALSSLEPLLGDKVAPAREKERQVRAKVVDSIRRRATTSFELARARRSGDPYEALSADARRLGQLEDRLVALSPDQKGFKEQLLSPLGAAYAREVLGTAAFARIGEYAQAVQAVVENLRRQGIDAQKVLSSARDVLEARLADHAQSLERAKTAPPPAGGALLNGEAYTQYRSELAGTSGPEGELGALLALEGQLSPPGAGAQPAPFVSPAVREAVARAELAALYQRVLYLRAWLAGILGALPEPKALQDRAEAERAFDRLVKSRFPMLAMKEGELVRLGAAVAALGRHPGKVGESARGLERALQGVGEAFSDFSRKLLEARASL